MWWPGAIQNHYSRRWLFFATQEQLMRPHPPLGPVEAGPSLLEDGHLWLYEYVSGPVLAFTMDQSGLLMFALDGEELTRVPPSIRRAVETVRQSIDRDALREGVEDVEQFVFYGFATRFEGIDYEWEHLPAFLGFDIWSETDSRFVAPDVADRVFDAIGLSPLPTFEREVPATRFDPERYGVPTSHWGEGTAAGVLVRNKGHGTAVLRADADGTESTSTNDETVAIQSAVACGLASELEAMDATVESVDVDAVTDHLFERVARVAYRDVATALENRPDDVRSWVGEAVREELRDRR